MSTVPINNNTIDFHHQINNETFKFSILIDNNEILISIERVNSEDKYENSFKKDDFCFFNQDELINFLLDKKFKLKIKDNKLSLKFNNENNSTDFKILLPMKNINNNNQNIINEIENFHNINYIANPQFEKFKKDVEKKINNLTIQLKQLYISSYKKDNVYETIFNSKIICREDIKIIQNFINPNDINEFKLLFSTNKMNDDSIETMHKFCDNQGPTIIIIKANGKIFGGYNSSNWDKSGIYINNLNSKHCFIFSLDKKEKYTLKNEDSCYSCVGSNSFILFGKDDLCIWKNCKNNELSYCEKNSYNIPDNYEITGGQKNFKVDNYEVYSVK